MRRREPVAAEPGDLPAELARFRFEDWLDPDDVAKVPPQGLQAGTTDDPLEHRAMSLIHVARQRWRAARFEWADERGIARRDLPSTVGPVADRP